MLLRRKKNALRVPIEGETVTFVAKKPERDMEQRIKVIWIVSLASMMLIVAGQGYWLWNQCQYRNEELVKEVRARVLEAAALNDSVRNLHPKKIFTDSVSVAWGTNSTRNAVVDSLGNEKAVYSYSLYARARLQKVKGAEDTASPLLYKDSICFRTKEELGWSFEKEMQKYKLQVDVPFTLQRFDSVLAVKLPGVSFDTQFCTPKDSLFVTVDSVTLAGSRLRPVVEVIYPYNPLGWQQVRVTVRPPLPMLLLRMGGQLLGSFLLILLLAFCLLFQIKTILKQHRIDELRKNFVNTMIHELKRPVQALKMCVAFLNDKSLRTDEQAMDEVIHDSLSELDNLSAYLSKLRDMTRADEEHTQLSVRTFDIRETVEKLVRLYHAPDGKELSFETRFSEATSVTADPVHLSNIVSNLIENAVKYSGPSVHIVVECLACPRQFILRVSDNGIGIPASEQGKVFDKFYRGTRLPDPSLPGIGLGLSYVKLLVEAHHGTVSLSSQVGKGTVVEIKLPQ